MMENPSPHSRLLPMYMGLAFLGVLAIGLILGFLARPLIVPDRVEVVEVAVTAELSSNNQSIAQTNPDSSTASEAEENASQSEAASAESAATPSIMELLLADARHVQGDADAPVTIIEFSDFK